MVTVFLTSCEKEEIISNTEQEIMLKEDVVYTLPEKCNYMTEDELDVYLESLTSNELSNFVSLDDELESRGGCSPWKYVGSASCWHDSKKTCWKLYDMRSQFKRQTRWCGSPSNGYLQVRWKYVGCC